MKGKRYYRITGLDEGVPITPYVIDGLYEELLYHLSTYGDMSRDCELIDKATYQKELKAQRDREATEWT